MLKKHETAEIHQIFTNLNVPWLTFFNIIFTIFMISKYRENNGQTLEPNLTTFLTLWAPTPTELRFLIINFQ